MEKKDLKTSFDKQAKAVEFTPLEKFQIEQEARNAVGSAGRRWSSTSWLSVCANRK